MSLAFKRISSPIGLLTIVSDAQRIRALLFENERAGRVPLPELSLDLSHPVLEAAEAQLKEYFAGEREEFDLPLGFEGTPFQNEVWSALRRIPSGRTCSYRDIATSVGRPTAVRAVGAAIGRNPICILVPCHRVIGSAGELRGFAGGPDKKTFLLSLERQFAEREKSLAFAFDPSSEQACDAPSGES